MRCLFVAMFAASVSAASFAQTEAEILGFAENGRKAVASGQMTPLQFYRELHRRIAITPIADYPFKAENLRVIGYRVDVYEAVEAGTLTADQAERRIVEQQAQWEAEGLEKARAEENAKLRAQQAQIERQRQLAAQDEASRRAMALQLLQSGALRAAPPKLTPYQIQQTPQTRCSSQWIGGQLQTVCN